MDKEPQKPISVQTSKEIFENISRKIENQKNGGPAPSLVEYAGLMMHELSLVKAENEAKKSPEQRAREAKESRARALEYAQEKAKKKYELLNSLFKDWIKRDTWLVYDEAMPLIKAEKPEEETMFNLRDAKLWSLIQSCAGHSLQIINLQAKPKQWRIKPFEWVRWLVEKEQDIHPQLVELIYPKTTIQPTSQTAKATQSRELTKRDRQKAIKAFALKADEFARKQGIEWSNDAIPVTKSDFLQVFGAIYTAHKKVTLDTFDRDIAEIGLKFKRGTKSNKNNVLKQLFSIT